MDKKNIVKNNLLARYGREDGDLDWLSEYIIETNESLTIRRALLEMAHGHSIECMDGMGY